MIEFKTFPFELKEAADDGSSFEGLVSVFHNIDDGGDIIDDKAFDQDMNYFMTEGFVGGLNHNWDNPVGTPQPGTKVVPAGLFLKANVIDTAHGMDLRKMLKAKVVKKLSIGYSNLGSSNLQTESDIHSYWESKGYKPSEIDRARATKGNVRLLMRVKPHEGSPVTMAMNNLANISAVKMAALQQMAGIAAASGTSVDDGDSVDQVKAIMAGPMGYADVADYFEGVEEDATCAALDALCCSMWSVIYDALYGYSEDAELSVDDRVSRIDQAISIFHDRAVTIARAILATDTDTGETGKSVEALAELKIWLLERKGASGSTTLPIAARDRAWDASAADKRVRTWAGAEDAPNAKYGSAFFFVDDDKTKFGSYHLGFADVIDGTLTAIPHGVFAAAGAVDGARGADGEKYAPAKGKIETYYSRFRKEFDDDTIVAPWAKSGIAGDDKQITTERELEGWLRDAAGLSKSDALTCISRAKAVLLRDSGGAAQPKAGDGDQKARSDSADDGPGDGSAATEETVTPPPDTPRGRVYHFTM